MRRYEFFAGRRLVTVFSAPNYISQFDNAGAVPQVDEQLTCRFRILKPVNRKSKSRPKRCYPAGQAPEGQNVQEATLSITVCQLETSVCASSLTCR